MKARSGGGALYQERGSNSLMTSSAAAVSATVRVTTPWVDAPSHENARSVTRPRAGLSPTRPVQVAGIRIEPPPSLAWAMVNMPLATADDAPPDEPPDVWSVFHGLRVIP